LLLNIYVAKRVNTKTLIQEQLKAKKSNVSETLSIPKPTEELKNVETLNSKNLVGDGNTPLPEIIKDQKIAEGVEKNTPGMAACIKNKVKDLAGVFTVPLGIPSFDQFKVPDINDAPNLSVKDAFKATFEDLKNTVKGTVNGIKEAFTFKKQQGLDQIETGGLSLKKFLGCEELDVDFTPRERKEAIEKPEIITKKEEEGVKKSQVALATQAESNVEKRTEFQPNQQVVEQENGNVKVRTEPPPKESKQEEVPTNTEVEEIPPLHWDYYSIRVYKTIESEDLEIGTMNALVDAGVGIIDSFSGVEDPEEFGISVINDVMDQNYKYVYDIVSEKDQNPDIAEYDINEKKKKENAIKQLPAGYFIVTLDIDNKDYFVAPATGFFGADNMYSIVGKYKKPGEKLPTKPLSIITDYRGFGEDTYIQADQQSVNGIFKGRNGENKFTSQIRSGKSPFRLKFK
jgi:hypothetical protein